MGLSSSKDASASSSSAAPPPALGVVRRTRSAVGTRVFHSSCLGRRPSHESDNNSDNHLPLDYTNNQNNKENGPLSHDHPTTDGNDDEDDIEEEEEEDEESRQVSKQQDSCTDDDITSSQEDAPSRSNRLRSRFTFTPSNLSFRLSRAASFGSSSSRPSYSLLSNNAFTTATAASAATQQRSLPSFIRNQGSDLRPIPLSTTFDATNLDRYTGSHSTHHPQRNNFIIPNQDDARVDFNSENTGIRPDPDYHTSRIDSDGIEFIQSRRASRRIEDREPVERSVRFSRTLSVGRLRDRVLRRSSFTDGLFGRLQQDREVGGSSLESRSQVLARISDSNENADISSASSTRTLATMSNSVDNNQNDVLDISRPRGARYHDIVEHRTDFLERRRRIRSQVRALQRLGSRFENLSGHERSCILAGQHRSGHCTCRTSNRARNPDDDTSARASISRIVMLAEALFEVLDEIHQQSVVLSSRPSVSSLGSIPAPKEVVESMPVKIYTKLQKYHLEDVAQCYICLVEYDEGDCMRVLPCHHEFHLTCIDKWLKEIHRVCPLCRGDVCRSDSLTSER